jgi:hypothetical protein
MLLAADEEQEAPKGEQSKDEQSSQISSAGSQPSDGKRDLSLSSPIKKPSWYEITLMDAQE